MGELGKRTLAPPSLPRRAGALDVLGVGVHPVGSAGILELIAAAVGSSRRAVVPHLNVHGSNLAGKHDWLREFFNHSQLVFCDGDGVRWGLKILGEDPPPKVTYNVWIWELARWCAEHRARLYLLGGRPGIAGIAADRLRERWPDLEIAGCHHGYFEKESSEETLIVEAINEADPDVLLVCLGMPVQEAWVERNALALGARVILTGGAALDYAAGVIRTTPWWIARLQLEWLYRLCSEPRRLFRRYVIGNPAFLLRVLRKRIRD